jgi:hypothetical protein
MSSPASPAQTGVNLDGLLAEHKRLNRQEAAERRSEMRAYRATGLSRPMNPATWERPWSVPMPPLDANVMCSRETARPRERRERRHVARATSSGDSGEDGPGPPPAVAGFHKRRGQSTPIPRKAKERDRMYLTTIECGAVR